MTHPYPEPIMDPWTLTFYAIVKFPRSNNFLYPFDPRIEYLLVPIEYIDSIFMGGNKVNGELGWYYLLRCQLGLELPLDSSRYIMGPDGPEHPVVDNTPELAKKLTGYIGEPVDALHCALLIICGAKVGDKSEDKLLAIQTANLLFDMTAGWNIGQQHPLEIMIRQARGVTLMEAAAAVLDHHEIVYAVSAERATEEDLGKFDPNNFRIE